MLTSKKAFFPKKKASHKIIIAQYVKWIKLNDMLLRDKFICGKNIRKVQEVVKTCFRNAVTSGEERGYNWAGAHTESS